MTTHPKIHLPIEHLSEKQGLLHAKDLFNTSLTLAAQCLENNCNKWNSLQTGGLVPS